MDIYQMELICCPQCKGELMSEGQENNGEISAVFRCSKCKSKFLTGEGFIHFINDDDVFRFDRRVQFMRSIYARYYTPLTNLMFIPCGGVKHARQEVLSQLEIHSGCSILETGIGTGDNILFLNDRIYGGKYFGLDNQLRMLRACSANLQKWKQSAELCRANAEQLPYRDNSFDVVYHLGAINLFQQKQQAINEMIRVARPGTKIVIADETEKAARLFSLFVGRQEPIVPPVDLVPDSMLQVKLETIWKGYGYLITFRKPG